MNTSMAGPFELTESALATMNEGVAAIDDRRGSARIPRALTACLVAHRDDRSLECTTVDLGEGGMCAYVSPDSGLAVGQRYDVTLTDQSGGLPSFVASCYATVVRTNAQFVSGEPQLSVGFRFDHPCYF